MSVLMDFNNIFKKYDLNITGIIHIGAHYGDELNDYLNNGVQDIVLFEPLSNNFDKLRENCINLNANIILIPFFYTLFVIIIIYFKHFIIR